VRVILDELRPEPAVEEVALVAVPPVEPPRIPPIQAMHPARDVAVWRLDEQMEVVRHPAIRVTPPLEPVNHVLEELAEPEPVAGIDVNRVFADAARRHVVDGAGKLNT
jgi:hypothetical protein